MIYSSKALTLFLILVSPSFNEFNFKLTNSIVADGLKLTPVQQLTQRIDLSSESNSIAMALNRAIGRKELTIEYENIARPNPPTLHHFYNELMESAEFQSLKSSMKRWGAIEEKLQLSMINENPTQMQIFEDIIHNVASGKVLFARTLLLSEESSESDVVNYLETSCPLLWKYASSWRSTDTDGWLDCFSTLNALYTKRKSEPNLIELEAKLSLTLPWLRHVVTGIDTSASTKPSLESLNALHQKDRQNLSSELKNSWTLIESIRSSFKTLVDDFMNSNSARIRLGTFIKAQQVTDEILEQFAKSTTVTERDSAAYLAESSRINLTLLRNKLHNEIKRETWTYLYVMNGVVENGESFIFDLRQKINAGATQEDLLTSATELMISGRIEFNDGERDTTTSGFIGINEVLRIFEAALESVQLKDAVLLSSHHADTISAQSAVDADKFRSTSSSKSAKKSAAGSSTRRSSKRTQQQPKEKSSSKQSSKSSSTSHPKKLLSSRWSMFLTYLGYATSSVAVLGCVATLCGYYIKLSRQPVKGGRSSFRYAANLLQLKLATATAVGTESSGDVDHSSSCVFKFFFENAHIFMHEIRLRIFAGLVFFWKMLSTYMDNMQTNRASSHDKPILAAKEMAVDCNPKSIALVVPCQVPSSPTTVATTSPGATPQRLLLPHNFVGPSEISGSSNPVVTKKQSKAGGKKKQVLTAAEKPTDFGANVLSTELTSFCADENVTENYLPVTVSDDVDCKTVDPVSESSTDSFALAPKVKSRKSQSNKKKISVPKPIDAVERAMDVVVVAPVEVPTVTDVDNSESVTTPDQVTSNEIDFNMVSVINGLVEPSHNDQRPSDFAALRSLLEGDLYLQDWNDVSNNDDGEWISASSAQNRSNKQASNHSESSKSSLLCKQQLARKAAEAAYSGNSPRVRLATSKPGRENVRAPRTNFIKTASNVRPSDKDPEVASVVLPALTPLSPQRADGKLDYSAVLVKNIPPSQQTVPIALKTTKQAEVGNASIQSNNVRKPQKVRNSHSAPPSNILAHQLQTSSVRPTWARTENRSIASTSTYTTNADEGEHGTLSDSDTSQPIPGNWAADDGMQFLTHPHHLMHTPQPLYPPLLMNPNPQVFSAEAMMTYNLQMMQSYQQQVPFPMSVMPGSWPCSPDILQQQFFNNSPPSTSPVMMDMNNSTGNATTGLVFPQIPPYFNPAASSPAIDGSNLNMMGYLMPFDAAQIAHNMSVHNVRTQIEYYFSDANLTGDSYLKGLMDSEGFVKLERIAQFNRIKLLRASNHHILEAVQSSIHLEAKESVEVRNARNNMAAMAALSDASILETKIRCARNPLAWVPRQSTSEQ